MAISKEGLDCKQTNKMNKAELIEMLSKLDDDKIGNMLKTVESDLDNDVILSGVYGFGSLLTGGISADFFIENIKKGTNEFGLAILVGLLFLVFTPAAIIQTKITIEEAKTRRILRKYVKNTYPQLFSLESLPEVVQKTEQELLEETRADVPKSKRLGRA